LLQNGYIRLTDLRRIRVSYLRVEELSTIDTNSDESYFQISSNYCTALFLSHPKNTGSLQCIYYSSILDLPAYMRVGTQNRLHACLKDYMKQKISHFSCSWSSLLKSELFNTNGVIVKVIPSVDLDFVLDFWKLVLNSIFVACNSEFLSHIWIIIWRVKEKNDLAEFSTIWLNPFKVVNNPSIKGCLFKKERGKILTWLHPLELILWIVPRCHLYHQAYQW